MLLIGLVPAPAGGNANEDTMPNVFAFRDKRTGSCAVWIQNRRPFSGLCANLLLLPVNLGGVFKSLHQAWTGQQIPFGRTPKIMGRTATPALYHMAGLLLFCYWLIESLVDAVDCRWFNALFALVNGGFFMYAILKYLGLKKSK